MNVARSLTVLLVVFATLGCAADSHARSRPVESIYRKGETSVLEVFNHKKSWYSMEGLGYLRRHDEKYGEWGGSFQDCSNEEYFCLRGWIGIVIPRSFSGQTQWQFGELSCRAPSPLTPGQTANFGCGSGPTINQFSFSQERGLISYVKGTEPDFTYTLVDGEGLFQQK